MTVIERTTNSGRVKDIPAPQRENMTLDLIKELEDVVEEETGMEPGKTTKRFIKGPMEIGFARQFEQIDGTILYTGMAELTMVPLIQPGAEPVLEEVLRLDFRKPIANIDELKRATEIIDFLRT